MPAAFRPVVEDGEDPVPEVSQYVREDVAVRVDEVAAVGLRRVEGPAGGELAGEEGAVVG